MERMASGRIPMMRGIVVDTTRGRVKAVSDMVGDDVTGLRNSDFLKTHSICWCRSVVAIVIEK